jgi:hypothetical protein
MAVQRPYPTPTGNGVASVPSRAGQDLSAYVLPLGNSNWVFGDEGTYYVATNATVGTGIAGHAAPVVADTDTKALLHVFNGTQYNLIPDYLFLQYTVIGSGGTIQYNVGYIDNKGSTALTSGGTTITPACTKSSGASAPITGAVVTFGACVTAMSSSVKVFNQVGREVIPVVQDTKVIKFGGPNGGFHSALTSAGTATEHMILHTAPFCIAPGGNLNIAEIRASQSSANSYCFEFGFVLR